MRIPKLCKVLGSLMKKLYESVMLRHRKEKYERVGSVEFEMTVCLGSKEQRDRPEKRKQ